MAQQVTILTWCDVHLADGQQEPGQTWPVTIGGAAAEVDLCDTHAKAWGLPELVAALHTYGRAPEGVKAPRKGTSDGGRFGRTPKGTRHLLCPWCPSTFAADSGLAGHARKVHGADGGPADWFHHQCPACGLDTGLLDSHCRKVHGDHLGQVVRQVLADGDPQGRVAAADRGLSRIDR